MPSHGDLCQRLFGCNPFDGFDLESWPEDLQGWGSQSPVFAEAFKAIEPDTVIEVGSWKGASAIHMADLMRERGTAGIIFCVDTWLGSLEHWVVPELREHLRLENGYPRLYRQFIANVLHRGHQDTIIPVPQTSLAAARWFTAQGMSAGLIYIDSGHEAETVHLDIEAWWPLVRPGGYLLGDDFSEDWPGVMAAAHWFAARTDLTLHHDDAKWWIRKPSATQ